MLKIFRQILFRQIYQKLYVKIKKCRIYGKYIYKISIKLENNCTIFFYIMNIIDIYYFYYYFYYILIEIF